MADGSMQAAHIATLDELALMARAIASAVDALQMSIAAQLQAECEGSDDFPMAVYEAAAAEGALDDAGPTWRERREEEREAMLDAQVCR